MKPEIEKKIHAKAVELDQHYEDVSKEEEDFIWHLERMGEYGISLMQEEVDRLEKQINDDEREWLVEVRNVIDGHKIETDKLNQTIESQAKEIENLKTVMIAAAEEIQEHWQAHCDDGGYGPANLMRRLENGLPSQYGYTAGAFMRQKELVDGQLNIIQSLKDENERLRGMLSEYKEADLQADYMSSILTEEQQIKVDTLLKTKQP